MTALPTNKYNNGAVTQTATKSLTRCFYQLGNLRYTSWIL